MGFDEELFNKFGYEVFISADVRDFTCVERTWRERLFSWPWKPWEKYQTIEAMNIFITEDNKIVASPNTKQMLFEALEKKS